ncbi:MAG TPA: DHH family phosphoesterase [Sulfuricurvum sp.]|nr:DHH family phosphoesterase [Sulfuricurvum sp.]
MPLSLIKQASHIVLVAHQNPDADSLGSACAFYSYVIRETKKVTLFCATELANKNLTFLPWMEKLTTTFPEDADLMISFDCGSHTRLGIPIRIPLINFDHHQSNELYGVINVVDTNAMSTTEVVYDFFTANAIKINGKMATALYAGLLEDSKNFTHAMCNAKTFNLAAALIEKGADHVQCIQGLNGSRSLASLRLRGALLRQMQLVADGEVAYFQVTAAILEQSGASVNECKGLLEEAMTLSTVRAALMSIEHPTGGIKLSLRTDGSINAADILSSLNGGGHVTRAGARLKSAIDHRASTQIIELINKETR